jgi:hypothetical protein
VKILIHQTLDRHRRRHSEALAGPREFFSEPEKGKMRKLILTHLFFTASIALAFFFSTENSAFAEVVGGSDNSPNASHGTL